MAKKPNIAAVREAVKLAGSQSALAAKAGCGQQTISDILTGRRALSLDIALKLSKATGVPFSTFRPDVSTNSHSGSAA